MLAAAADREVDQGLGVATERFVHRLDGFVTAPGGIGCRHCFDPRIVAFAQMLQVFPRHLCRVDQGAAQVHGDARLFVAAVHFLFLFAAHHVKVGALCIEVDVTGTGAFVRAECQPLFFGERPACAPCMDDGALFAVMPAGIDGDVAVYRANQGRGVPFQVQGVVAALATAAKGDADAARAHQAYFVFAVPLFAVVGVLPGFEGDVALAGL